MKDNKLSYFGNEAAKGSPNKFSGNQHTKTNPDALINKGRGPTGGGTQVPASKEIVMGCHNPQVRNPGGTREMPRAGKTSFDFGRGPTKGNA